jgi:histidine triad (HIT) family protein
MKDPNCIFCKIVAGESPAYTVYEDENFLAFLSIFPTAPGHTLIIPKDHHRWVWDVPNVGNYFEVARKVAKAQQQAFNTEMIRSKIVGEEVPHAHIWVFPHDQSVGTKENFIENAEKIKRAM